MLNIIIVVILYLGLLYTAINKKKDAFVGILIVLCCLYDYLFIGIGYIIPSSIVGFLKPFQESIILLGCILILLRKKDRLVIRISYREKILIYCVVIPLIISIISSTINGMEFSILISGLRCFFVPIFCAYIITHNGRVIIKSYIFEIISILIVSFAIYQVLTFSGNLNELWVYNSKYNEYGENEVDKFAYNFIKNESLRAISFFVTPIDLSVTSAICALYFICAYCNIKKFKFLIYVLISIYGIFLSQTRIGFYALFIGIGIILYLKTTNLAKKSIMIVAPIVMIPFTLAYIFFIDNIDLSALGRLEQYIEFEQTFTILGRGLGDKNAVFSYDSFILCCLNLFGITGILYFSFYLFLLLKAIYIYNHGNRDILTSFTIVLSSTMLYVFGFHHIAGSFVYWLVILLLFNTISLNMNKHIINANSQNRLFI